MKKDDKTIWTDLTPFHRMYILTQGKYNLEKLKKIGNAVYLPRVFKQQNDGS